MKKAEEHKSSLIDELMTQITPEEQERSNNRMLMATKINEAMKKMGLKKGDLATLLGKNRSVITRWLSGTQNFTIDTLSDIQKVLNIKLINIEKEEYHKENVINFVVPTINLQQDINDSYFANDQFYNGSFCIAKA